MFEKNTYVQRRNKLRQQVGRGVILLPGNNESPMNYAANTYPFRQDSTFLYFTGLDKPGLAVLIDCEEKSEVLFGDDVAVDDIIWMGPQPRLIDAAHKVGIKEHRPLTELEDAIKSALLSRRHIHYLPPYRADKSIWLENLLGIRAAAVRQYASLDLISAVIAQRSQKSVEEIQEIEAALQVSAAMYVEGLRMARPGLREEQIAGKMQSVAQEAGMQLAFPPIVTVHGETLHNAPTQNRTKKGDLLLIDMGAASPRHYASDITRTYPVAGKFTGKQRDVYETVYRMQEAALNAIQPGVPYKEIHLLAARILAQHFKDLGLLKGDPQEAVAAGAHALFFPHGLGHMMGLDVHDMEDLGENHVGYDGKTRRAKQFGLSALRLARHLEPGFIMTVEPGAYFIPALIDLWKKEKKHAAFINYAKVESYRNFGGCRIEDNVLVTSKGVRLLGPAIPKKIEEIENRG